MHVDYRKDLLSQYLGLNQTSRPSAHGRIVRCKNSSAKFWNGKTNTIINHPNKTGSPSKTCPVSHLQMELEGLLRGLE